MSQLVTSHLSPVSAIKPTKPHWKLAKRPRAVLSTYLVYVHVVLGAGLKEPDAHLVGEALGVLGEHHLPVRAVVLVAHCQTDEFVTSARISDVSVNQ